jgi:hypothetical protein
VPAKYAQLALSIETMLDLSTLSLEDVTGQLCAVEDRAPPEKEKPKLLLMEEWSAQMKEKRKTGEGSSRGGGDRGGDNGGKQRGKALAEKKKFSDPNACGKCGEVGHWARECSNKKLEKEVHLARDDSDGEHALLMGVFCAESDGAEEAEVEQKSAPPVVHLDEPRAQVHLGAAGDESE